MTATTIELLKAWFIFSFSLGCWTCINLLASRKGDRRAKNIILCFVVLLLVPPMHAYLSMIAEKPAYWILIVSQKLTWCFGPLMVMLIRQLLLQKNQYSALHALPFALAAAHDMLNLHWISFQVMTVLLFIQVFIYLGYAIQLLLMHRIRLLTLTSHFKSTSYYWSVYLVAGLALIMLFDLTIYSRILLGHTPSFLFSALTGSMVAIYVNTIALFSIYQPDVFFQDIIEPATEEPPVKTPLRSVELTSEAAHQLDQQLQQLVISHKPHLDENISLPKLASLLGVTTHQLSELLNTHKATNFYDFLNGLRHQESLNFLTLGESELTIADIAYRSGYNNLNTFYKVFKEKTGQTPSQFKKSKHQL